MKMVFSHILACTDLRRYPAPGTLSLLCFTRPCVFLCNPVTLGSFAGVASCVVV